MEKNNEEESKEWRVVMATSRFVMEDDIGANTGNDQVSSVDTDGKMPPDRVNWSAKALRWELAWMYSRDRRRSSTATVGGVNKREAEREKVMGSHIMESSEGCPLWMRGNTLENYEHIHIFKKGYSGFLGQAWFLLFGICVVHCFFFFFFSFSYLFAILF